MATFYNINSYKPMKLELNFFEYVSKLLSIFYVSKGKYMLVFHLDKLEYVGAVISIHYL